MKEVDAIKKKGEVELSAIKKKGEAALIAFRKEGEARSQKNKEEIEAIKKAGEAKLQKLHVEMAFLKKQSDELTIELKQSQKDLHRQLYNLGINIGFGVEESIYNLLSTYKNLDEIKYDKVYKNNVYNDLITKATKGESDIIMINGRHAAIIEIKHRVTCHHISEFYLKKLPIFTQYETRLMDKIIHIYFAGESFEADAIQEAKNRGCGLIEPMYNDIATIVKAI